MAPSTYHANALNGTYQFTSSSDYAAANRAWREVGQLITLTRRSSNGRLVEVTIPRHFRAKEAK